MLPRTRDAPMRCRVGLCKLGANDTGKTWTPYLNTSSFHYFSGEVPAAASSDVNLSDLEVDMLNHGNMSRGMLWMGSAGVIAQTHHDRSYNLSPKSPVARLYLCRQRSEAKNMHPSYHGSRRQSQISHSLRSASDDELSGRGNGRSVDPVPGCSESDNVCRESTTPLVNMAGWNFS